MGNDVSWLHSIFNVFKSKMECVYRAFLYWYIMYYVLFYKKDV